MRAAEKIWNTHSKGKMTLIDLFNYHNQLGAQLPIRDLRVVYSKAGTLPAAAVIRDGESIVENTLYWWSPDSEAEAHYLVAILNSETSRKRIEDVQARGQFGARHFDKAIFNLPIPRFAKSNPQHVDLSKAAKAAEGVAAAASLPEGVLFQRARRLVRDALVEAKVSQKIDALVADLLQ